MISQSTLEWLKRGNCTDKVRGEISGPKLLFWIKAWELIRSSDDWLNKYDLMEATGASDRQCRRLMFRFAASGLCEMRLGHHGGFNYIRLKKEGESHAELQSA